MSNPFRGEVPFGPLADLDVNEGGVEGAKLCFLNSTLLVMKDKFGEDFAEAIRIGMDRADPEITHFCLTHTLMDADGNHLKIDLDDYPFPLADASFHVMNALTMSRLGIGYTEALEAALQVQDQEDKLAAHEAAGYKDPDPIKGSPSSNVSGDTVSEQG